MNIVQKYIDYLKDNPKRYWFKRKIWGWGWTPATWEGWLTLFVFIILIVWNFLRIDRASHSISDTLIGALVPTAVLIAALIVVCYSKGERPRWSWGFPKKDSNTPR